MEKIRDRLGGDDRTLALALGALIVTLAVLTALPMDSPAQLVAAATLIAVMWICRSLGGDVPGGLFRVLALLIGVVLSLRYILWRGLFTLIADDPVSTGFAVILFLAELYSITLHVLGCIVNATAIERPDLTIEDLAEAETLPSVDVLVPSYNEAPDLLEITLRAALMMRYPADRLRVCLLDDGATEAKINDSDPVRRAAARERRATLRTLCRRLGVTYIARRRNEHAKAGNVNYGLRHTAGDLVVILDADHVPTIDFLDRTVPWLVRYPDVFLVQTPHFMINPDPVDRNLLRSFHRMPAENDMFYQTIQKGLDFWASSFFCGSAAILRRRHLEEAGGLMGETITEDAETALDLHRRGYRSIYVDRPMVAGLAPETFTGFVTQRMRWAQGMTQILLLKRPFMAAGLTWYQRIGYMSALLFWLFPFARIVFLLAPFAYLALGLRIYNASIWEILAYTVPHLIAIYTTSDLQFGRTRWPLISELYETMQCLFSLRAVTQVIRNPRKPAFIVTPKGGIVDDEIISPLSRPFYVLITLVLLGFAGGIYRLYESPLTRDLTIIVILWNLFNFLVLLAALGALLERRQRRAAPRMQVHDAGQVRLPGGGITACDIDDISAGGARLLLDGAGPPPSVGETALLSVRAQSLNRQITLPCHIRSVHGSDGKHALGVSFDLTTDQATRDAIALTFGDSARWRYFLDRRSRPIPFGTAVATIARLVWHPIIHHLSFLAHDFVARRVRPLWGNSASHG